MGNNVYFDLSKNKTGRERLEFSRSKTKHPAGTSIVSDICDLSKVSDIDPLTWGSMRKSFFITYFVSHIKSISVKISGKYIYRKI